jgi:hypothetical protein
VDRDDTTDWSLIPLSCVSRACSISTESSSLSSSGSKAIISASPRGVDSEGWCECCDKRLGVVWLDGEPGAFLRLGLEDGTCRFESVVLVVSECFTVYKID